MPDRARGIAPPTGPAATQRVTLDLDQGGWEFVSPLAVQIQTTPNLGEGRSGATLVLSPEGTAVISLRPKRRNASQEATQFFAEASNLFLPGPGVVDGYARVTVRPAQGRVAELDLDIPKGFTVGEVSGGPVGTWRFDSQRGRLHLTIEPAQTEPFKFNVETQLGTGASAVRPFARTAPGCGGPGAGRDDRDRIRRRGPAGGRGRLRPFRRQPRRL